MGAAVESKEGGPSEKRFPRIKGDFGGNLTTADERPAATGEGLELRGVAKAGPRAEWQPGGVKAPPGSEGDLDAAQTRWRRAIGAADIAIKSEVDRREAFAGYGSRRERAVEGDGDTGAAALLGAGRSDSKRKQGSCGGEEEPVS
jgi:hypothetical protein